jgi:hypothetical protein
MVRLSRRLGKNLGLYFDRWGVPVSQTAKNAVKELPVWLPYGEDDFRNVREKNK